MASKIDWARRGEGKEESERGREERKEEAKRTQKVHGNQEGEEPKWLS